MPQLGVPELVIILVIIVIIFGVGRLPEIGGAIGKSIREFRSAASNGADAAADEAAPQADGEEQASSSN
ncbi:MAG: twin-arginine translocase TatA/TatE family subunit [Anaerolineae bacterium]